MSTRSLCTILVTWTMLVGWASRPAMAGPAPAPSPRAEAVVEDRMALINSARGVTRTALALDVAGYLGVSVGSSLVGEGAIAAGLDVASASCGLLVVASVLGTTAYTVQQRAFVRAGYDVSPAPLAMAWTLTSFSVLAYGVSIPLAVQAADEESVGLALASIAMWGTAGAVELLNWLVVRQYWWRRTFELAPRRSPAATVVVPTFSTVSEAGTERRAYVLGLAGTF